MIAISIADGNKWGEALKNLYGSTAKIIQGCFSFRLKDVSVQSVGILGTTEQWWHTPSNGKKPFARATRGTFNNEPANVSRKF